MGVSYIHLHHNCSSVCSHGVLQTCGHTASALPRTHWYADAGTFDRPHPDQHDGDPPLDELHVSLQSNESVFVAANVFAIPMYKVIGTDTRAVFLLRPSLRRLLARLRSQPGTLDDLDREVINMTYGACRAITQLSKYMTRTVSLVPCCPGSVVITEIEAEME